MVSYIIHHIKDLLAYIIFAFKNYGGNGGVGARVRALFATHPPFPYKRENLLVIIFWIPSSSQPPFNISHYRVRLLWSRPCGEGACIQCLSHLRARSLRLVAL
jgi:hypothetical protein